MRIGLGCVTFGREIDEAASFRLLDYAVERGISLLDTAESMAAASLAPIAAISWAPMTNAKLAPKCLTDSR